MADKKYPYKSKKEICYHGRCGYPIIHLDEEADQDQDQEQEYIMVRKKGGGTKRLYLTKEGRVPAKLREKKRKREPSGYNICVGKEMKGTKSTGKGDKEFQKKFVESMIACGANVSDKTKKKWKIK